MISAKSESLRCPEGCTDRPNEELLAGQQVIPAKFEWVDGSIGENNYCRDCGAELVKVES